MVIVVGALLTFASSWLGLVLLPYIKLQREPAFTDPGVLPEPYPRPLGEKAAAGRVVYQREGCLYCHSQQVRSERFGNWWENGAEKTGADIRRGWGTRRTVSRDYLYDHPTLLGTMRTGPDLSTIGKRNRAFQWHHTHLLNPRSQNGWSVMPSFPWLYTREAVSGDRSGKALDLGREWTVSPGYRWRPTDREWQAILAAKKDVILPAFAGANPDVGRAEVEALASTPARRARLLDYWLTTREEGFQLVPTADGDALFEYLLALDKNAVDLPEAKE